MNEIHLNLIEELYRNEDCTYQHGRKIRGILLDIENHIKTVIAKDILIESLKEINLSLDHFNIDSHNIKHYTDMDIMDKIVVFKCKCISSSKSLPYKIIVNVANKSVKYEVFTEQHPVTKDFTTQMNELLEKHGENYIGDVSND